MTRQDFKQLWRFSMSLTSSQQEAEALICQSCQYYQERRALYFAGCPNQRKLPGDRRKVRCLLLGILYRCCKDQYRKAPVHVYNGTNKDLKHRQYMGNCGRLVSIVQKLPEAQRLVVLLVCVEELSHTETAEILNLSLATVDSRLIRARVTIGRHYLFECDNRTGYNRA